MKPELRHGPFASLAGFTGKADITLDSGQVQACFQGQDASHTLRYTLEPEIRAAGLASRFRLRSWASISYVAIGYTWQGDYRHIKAKHVRQDHWVELAFTHDDLIWKIQNGFAPVDDADIGDIRWFIKGVPGPDGAWLDIASLEIVQSSDKSTALETRYDIPEPLDRLLHEHLAASFKNHAHDAAVFLDTGEFPVPGGQRLKWPLFADLPSGLDQVTTYRMAWHAQHLAISLLLTAQNSEHPAGAVHAAGMLIQNWLENSFSKADADPKFTWYDHGVAERQLAFILMWRHAGKARMDSRFMAQLSEAILRQAALLESEAFYAYNMPTRYHNHAWFQDIALLATALAFPDLQQSRQWQETAISRFENQLDKLIVRDQGYAIFIENSIGYHHGAQRLAELVGQLVSISGKNSEIPQIANELIAWSDFLRYPDGRAPAQGDTFRLPPRTGSEIRRGKPWENPGCTILPKAGYAVVKGNHDGLPWMLCFFNTSLCPTHKHEDNLSFTIWFDGIEWLIDPSFYSHEYKEDIPAYLRSAKAHNTATIEGLAVDYNNIKSSLTNKECNNEIDFSFCASYYVESSNIVVGRCVDGNFNKIHNVFNDYRQDACDKGLVLNFIFGDHVVVDVVEGAIEVSHVDSVYILHIVVDDDFEPLISKVPGGHGFMSKVELNSIKLYPVDPKKGCLRWKLLVSEK